MSICPEQDVCSLYVDGELSAKKRESFEQHVKECRKCKHNVETYRKLKDYISCREVPEIDLKEAYDALVLKRFLKNSFLLYRLVYSWKKNKMLLKSSVVAFLFVLMLVPFISIRNRITEPSYNPPFKPIIPLTYESHFPANLKSLHFSSINVNLQQENNVNTQVYKNMANTFNGFSNLYSDLEHNEKCTCGSNMPVMNRAGVANYYVDMPFYNSLNKK